MENIFVEFLPPWIETGLQPAFYDKESGTVLQQTARMYARVNMLIRMFNKLSKNTKTTVEDYINRFDELYTYVHDYFDNLDVQEEINNKLDEMYEDGTLTDVIDEFLQYSKSSYMINEINSYNMQVDNCKGKVYVTRIPHLNSDNEVIPIKHGFANDMINTGTETPTEFSERHGATFVSNASVYNLYDSHPPIPKDSLLGIYIHDGTVIYDNRANLDSDFLNNRYILGIKADNTLHSYKGDTASSTLISDGIIETVQAFIPLLINGTNQRVTLESAGSTYWDESTFSQTADETPAYDKIYFTLNNVSEYVGHFHLSHFDDGVTYYEEVNPERHNRQIIAQNNNGDIFFITTNGNGREYNIGLSLYEFTALAENLGCTFAFVLDGGGSTASIDRNIMLNHPTDGSSAYQSKYNGLGTTIRPVADFLYFAKEMATETDKAINYAFGKIQDTNKRIDDHETKVNNKFMSTMNLFSNENEQFIFDKKSWNSETNTFDSQMRIYLDNKTGFPHGLSINKVVDDVSTPILRLQENENNWLQYLGKKVALMYNEIEWFANDTDLDNLGNGFVIGRSHIDRGLNGSPFASGDGFSVNYYWLVHFGFSNLKTQIAFGIYKWSPAIRIRMYAEGWGPWTTIIPQSS